MSTTAEYVETSLDPSNSESPKVKYIKADLACVNVENINGTVMNSGKYGVNGTFFSGGNLVGIAMSKNSSGTLVAVRNGGDQTGDSCSGVSPTKRGTMYHYNTSSVDTKVIRYISDTGVSSSSIKWAIGGYSLHPNVTYTESQYLSAIQGTGSSCVDYTENAHRLSPSTLTSRTAIGWTGTKIILAVFQSAKAYTVRQFMINLGCTRAVMLDGGGSSQLRARVSTPYGNFDSTYDPKAENRNTLNMVTVNPTTWTYTYIA